MPFEKPKLFFNNAARDAQTGNDGTAYATCAEAIADTDDPNKVRGDIRPAADIPDLATLEGSGIVFDTTKNEYRITDSEALMRRLSGTSLLLASLSPGALIIEGSFLYVFSNHTPVVATKIAIPALTIVAQIKFPTGENYARAVVKYGNDFFVACRNGSNVGVLVQMNIASFSRTNAITFDSGETYPRAAVVYGSDIFVACKNGSNDGVLVRCVNGTQRLSALTLSSTENDPVALVVYGTDIFVLCADGSSVAVIVRTAGGLTRTSALTLSATEINPTAMVLYGTDIFVACNNASNVGVIVRTAGGLSRTSALTLAANEYWPVSMIVNGTDIFVACYNSSTTYAVVVRTAGGTSRTSALALNAGDYVPSGSDWSRPQLMVLSGSNIYLGCFWSVASPVANIIFLTGGTARTSSLLLSAGEYDPAAIVKYSGQFFVACRDVNNIGVLVRLGPDLSRLNALSFNTGELYPSALIVLGTDIFVACRNGSNVGVLVRTAGGITRTSALTLSAGELYPSALVIYGPDIFIACRDGSNTAMLIRTAAGLTRTSALTLTATSETYPSALLVYGTDIFVACRNGSNVGTIVRTNAGLTRTSVLTLDAGDLYPAAMALYGTDIFIACRNGSNVGVIVRTAGGLTRTSALTLNAGELYPAAMVFLSSLLMVVCRDGSNVTVLVKLPSGTSRLDALTLDAADLYGSAVLVEENALLIAVKNSDAIGSVVNADPYQSFTLFSRLQTADIGDSFTVRAGITCAQATALRPVDYAADGHLAPRFKGLLNTQHKIRIHAPNYITDGGFESGAFSPNWTAGTGWSINSSSPMEGAYEARHALAVSSENVQSRTGKLEAGETYSVVFKAKTVTANGTAGLLTVAPRLAGAGAVLDSTVNGNAPLITTTAAWYSFNFTPAVSTDRWELALAVDVTKKDSATVLAVDEVYLYAKRDLHSLIVDSHNWAGRGAVQVKNYWCSPLRSTALPREQEAFTRASVAYLSDGTQVASGLPRYEAGKYGSAIMVEADGATNLLTANQASVETDLAGIGKNIGTETHTRVTTEHWHGNASVEVITPGGVPSEGAFFAYSTSVQGTYCGQAHVLGSGTINVRIKVQYTDLSYESGTATVQTLTPGIWNEILAAPFTTNAGKTVLNVILMVTTNSTQAVTFYVDGTQVVLKTYNISWQLPGAARAEESCLFNPSGIITPGEGTIAFWAHVDYKIKKNGIATSQMFWHATTGNENRISIGRTNVDNIWYAVTGNAAGTTSTSQKADALADGWHHFAARWSAAELCIFVDGVAGTPVASPNIPSALASVAYKGQTSNTFIDDVRIWRRVLTDTEIAAAAARATPAPVDADCTAVFSFDSTLDSGYQFSPTDARTILQFLPVSELPCAEITLPAVSGWTPEAGDIYLGDTLQAPRYPQGSLDPYGTNADGLVEFELDFRNLNPALRLTWIEDLFDRLRANEGIWSQWDTQKPLLMESPRTEREAPYNPTRTDLKIKLRQRL